jgi:hypothetical protein
MINDGKNSGNNMINIALRYKELGYEPLPINYRKEPVKGCMWKRWGWQKILEQFSRDDVYGVAVRTGRIEVIDVDNKLGTASDILEILTTKLPFLIYCTIAKSQSYGYHIIFRYNAEGNKKLAYQKDIYGDWQGVIETRGVGGYIVVAPTKGYTFIQNDMVTINSLSPDERDRLFRLCRSLNRRPIRKERMPDLNFNDNGIISEAKSLLRRSGWKFSGRHVTRPGKKEGTSATFGMVAPGVFYVFTANGGIFDADKGYSSFQVVAKLKFNEDFKAATKYCKEKYG